MATLTLQLQGLNEAIRNIENFGAKKKREIIGELDRTALAIETGAKRNLTRNRSRNTGRLISSVVRQSTGEYKRTTGTNVIYGPHVEFGTRAHVIVPVRAKALKTPYGFFKKVNHPGSRPKPFLFPAAESERANFVRNLTAILSRA